MISGSKMKASIYAVMDEVANEIAERQYEYLEKAIDNGKIEYFATRKVSANKHTMNQIADWSFKKNGIKWLKIRKVINKKSQEILERRLKSASWSISYGLEAVTLRPIS